MPLFFGSRALLEAMLFEFGLFAGIVFLVIGLDELLVDLIWLGIVLGLVSKPGFRGLEDPAGRMQNPENRGWFAIMIPVWDEAQVIGSMLTAALKSYAGKPVHVYVGCYPNDAATRETVASFVGPRLTLVVNAENGPTTKGQNLNQVWNCILRDEHRRNRRFDGYILHDAEDLIDPHEITVFDSYRDRYAMIQLPVIPLWDVKSPWIAGHYCDEFAESHGKTLIVRHALGASLPSAGVGCMFTTEALDGLAELGNGNPFPNASLTEDYEAGLRLSELGFSTAFLPIGAPNGPELVATRAHFPGEWDKAIGQKSRWIAGIALTGWDRLLWGQGWFENWMRMRDRLPFISAVASIFGYLAMIFGMTCIAGNAFSGFRPIAFDPMISALTIMNAGLLVWRSGIRFHFCQRHYGIRTGLLSILRIPLGNWIAIQSTCRAISNHFADNRSGSVRWEKTAHKFPDPAP